MNIKKTGTIVIATFLFVSSFQASKGSCSDFDFSNAQVDQNAFKSGGPPKDGIPALTNPEFIKQSEAKFLDDDERVVGVVINGIARAYPLSILNWHEIVNDVIDETPVAITWCPLTKSAVVFDRNVNGQTLEFGVSGLLYNSNVVMYDRNYDGLWSQMKMGGLTGKGATAELKNLPSQVTTWKQWRQEYPNSLVLSRKTGHRRDYQSNPYEGYHNTSQVMFPLPDIDDRVPPKSLVVGIRLKDKAKAYPLDMLQRITQPINDQVAGVDITIFPALDESVIVQDTHGNRLASVVAYWFAWSGFNQDSLLYKEK